jgi:hypothetical protein
MANAGAEAPGMPVAGRLSSVKGFNVIAVSSLAKQRKLYGETSATRNDLI